MRGHARAAWRGAIPLGRGVDREPGRLEELSDPRLDLGFGSAPRPGWFRPCLDDLGEAIPAFLTLVTMPLAFGIADGLAVGFISYTLLQALADCGRRVSWLAYLLALLFLLRFALL